jgi:hypothetical protein
MIRFQHEGHEYQIRVEYWRCGIPADVRTIEVSIMGTRIGLPCFKGVARCSPKDNFSKCVGRKIALDRALRATNRSFRKAAWQAYKAECRLP